MVVVEFLKEDTLLVFPNITLDDNTLIPIIQDRNDGSEIGRLDGTCDQDGRLVDYIMTGRITSGGNIVVNGRNITAVYTDKPGFNFELYNPSPSLIHLVLPTDNRSDFVSMIAGVTANAWYMFNDFQIRSYRSSSCFLGYREGLVVFHDGECMTRDSAWFTYGLPLYLGNDNTKTKVMKAMYDRFKYTSFDGVSNGSYSIDNYPLADSLAVFVESLIDLSREGRRANSSSGLVSISDSTRYVRVDDSEIIDDNGVVDSVYVVQISRLISYYTTNGNISSIFGTLEKYQPSTDFANVDSITNEVVSNLIDRFEAGDFSVDTSKVKELSIPFDDFMIDTTSIWSKLYNQLLDETGSIDPDKFVSNVSILSGDTLRFDVKISDVINSSLVGIASQHIEQSIIKYDGFYNLWGILSFLPKAKCYRYAGYTIQSCLVKSVTIHGDKIRFYLRFINSKYSSYYHPDESFEEISKVFEGLDYKYVGSATVLSEDLAKLGYKHDPDSEGFSSFFYNPVILLSYLSGDTVFKNVNGVTGPYVLSHSHDFIVDFDVENALLFEQTSETPNVIANMITSLINERLDRVKESKFSILDGTLTNKDCLYLISSYIGRLGLKALDGDFAIYESFPECCTPEDFNMRGLVVVDGREL